MADFSPEQVTAFIQKWLQHDLATGMACLSELKQAQHDGLRDLARTPLLLNLLCLTYDELGYFPQRRVGLYEEALNVLLVKWDSSRRIRRDELYKQLDLGRKRHLLAHVAAATFGQGKYFISKNEMVRNILDYLQTIPGSEQLNEGDGEAVLRAIEAQHGILVERARGVYGFTHLTFQEYFTAKYVAEAGGKSWDRLIAHCANYQWREVFLLTASLLGEAGDFFGRFLDYLDQWIDRDARLTALLQWATEKTTNTEESAPMLLIHQCLYIYLTRDLARDFALNRDLALALTHAHDLARDRDLALNLALALARHFDLDLARVLASVRVFDLAVDLARALPLDFDSNRIRARNRDLARALARDLVLARSLSPLIALDFALVYASLYGRFGFAGSFIKLAYDISKEQGLTTLHHILQVLVVPNQDAPTAMHKKFTKTLWQIAQVQRRLQVFEFTEIQAHKLADYLEGATLLVECLMVAAVNDREGILLRLLAPPGD